MAVFDVGDYLGLLAPVLRSPGHFLWSTYDEEADVLYVNFKKPARATDSELTKGDVIIRYEGDDVIGFTVLHASRRNQAD